MVRTLFPLVVCVVFAVCLASPQREDRGQLITSQHQQRVLQQQQQQQRQPLQRQSQPRKINTDDQVPALGMLASRTDIHLPAVGDAELQRFLDNEEAVTALAQCFITPKQCSSKLDLKIIRQVRGLGPGGVCKTCTKEDEGKLHNLIYEFMQQFITRYPQLWRKVIPHLGNLITFAQK